MARARNSPLGPWQWLKPYLFIVWCNRWILLTPMAAALAATMAILMFIEPIYLSKAKLWVQELAPEGIVLQYHREGLQETTFAEIQAEILTSNGVLGQVIDLLSLTQPAPSRSLFATYVWRWNDHTPPPPPEEADARLTVLKALQKAISVRVLNPEVLEVSAKANSSAMAAQLLDTTIAVYRSYYQSVLDHELAAYSRYLSSQIDALRRDLMDGYRALLQFEMEYPLLVAQRTGYTAFPGVTDLLSEMVPLPELLRKYGAMDLSYGAAKAEGGSDSYLVSSLRQQLHQLRRFLEKYQRPLGELAGIEVQYQNLQWEKKVQEKRYDSLIDAYDKLQVAQGATIKQTSSITILDEASVPNRPLFPRRKLSLAVACFIGLLMGIGMLYVWLAADNTIYTPQQLRRYTHLPLLAVVDERE